VSDFGSTAPGAALEAQRREFDEAFRSDQVASGAGQPRILTSEQYDRVRSILELGGWHAPDEALFDAVRGGAQPGDAIPPYRPVPIFRGVHDIQVRVVGEGENGRVAVFFSHEDFPEVLFAYRCKPPGDDRYELVWLQEELATGALHRMMRYDTPVSAEDGLIWTRLYGSLLSKEGESDTSRLVLRSFAHVGPSEGGTSCGIYVPGKSQPGPCGKPSVARAPYSLWLDSRDDVLYGAPVQRTSMNWNDG
jgi:hypothetical protein